MRNRRTPTPGPRNYVVQAGLSTTAPGGDQSTVYTELVRWYWTGSGWSASTSRAKVFANPSDGVACIGRLRDKLPGVELALLPSGGMLFYKPV